MGWLFGFEGRINRAKYVLAILIYVIPFSIGSAIADHASAAIGAAILLPVAFMMAMPAAKRLHDLDHSGWWQLLGLIPLVNIGLGIYLLFWKGTTGSNRFGVDPLGVEERKLSYPSVPPQTMAAPQFSGPAETQREPISMSSVPHQIVAPAPVAQSMGAFSTEPIPAVDEDAIYAMVAEEMDRGEMDRLCSHRLMIAQGWIAKVRNSAGFEAGSADRSRARNQPR